MKKNGKKLNKNLKTAVIIIAVLLVVSIAFAVSFAEFTKSSRAKRVVATYLTGGATFSSNYLVPNNNTAANVYKRFFYTSQLELGATGTVSVCNYPQGDPGKYYEKNIIYRLTAKIVKVTENNGVVSKADATASQVGDMTVTLTFKGGTPVTLSSSNLSNDFGTSTLSCLSAATDLLDVSFSADFNDNAEGLCLYVCATPEPPLPNINTIDAVIIPTLSVQEAKNNWEGSFNENTSNPISGYDGFNYVISGTGTGTCTLKWRSDKLKISQVFLNEISGTEGTETIGGNTWNTLEFDVDSDLVNRYDLQFYFCDGVSGTILSWDELTGTTGDNPTTGYVTLTYEE